MKRQCIPLLLALFCLCPMARAVDYHTENTLKALWRKAPVNTITVPRVKTPPRIDGALDDDAWKLASTAGNYINMRYGLMRGQEMLTTCYSLAQAQTRNWICRTEDALYVAFRAEEPEIESLHLDYTGRDGRLWVNDCVELLFEPKEGTVIHFIIDGKANVYDARTGDGKAWNLPDVEKNVAARIVKDGQDIRKSYWTVEMRIPFDAIGVTPKDGDVWGGNFGRERYAPAYKAYGELCTWSGLFTTFGDTAMFGRWVFTDIAVRAMDMVAETDLDHPYLAGNRARVELLSLAGKANAKLALVVTTGAGDETLVARDMQLTNGKPGSAVLDYTLSSEGVGYASLVATVEGNVIASSRLPFRSEEIGAMLDEGIRNARALKERADPKSEFGMSIAPYVEQLVALKLAYLEKKQALLKQPATHRTLTQWEAMHRETKSALRAGSYTVWTCSPYLPVGHSTYPAKLEGDNRIVMNACVNEYENAVVNLTNFTGEDMTFYIQGNAPHAACNLRGGFDTPIRSVVENHGNQLMWTASTKAMSATDDGLAMPLLDLGEEPQVLVRAYSTRQLWVTVNTTDAKPTVGAGKKGKAYRGGLRFIPVSHNLAIRNVAIELNVYDFEIPYVAELGSYSFNYATPMPFLTDYKINQFMLAAWPNPKIRKDGTIDISAAVKRLRRDVAKINPGPGRPFTFVLSYGYVGSFIAWADKQKIPYMSDEWKRLFTTIFKMWVDELKNAGLDYDDFVVQSIDEAHGYMVKQLAETVPLLRAVDPKVRFGMTIMASHKELVAMAPYTDVWFNRNGAHYNLPFLHKEKAAGKPLYSWHMSGDMHSPVISWTRTYGWRAWKHGFDEIGYFVFSSSCYRWQRDNPIPSRMLEAWRDTIEDWQYFNALKKTIAVARERGVAEEKLTAAQATMDQVLADVLEQKDNIRPFFPSDTQATADRIEAARVKLAETVLAVQALRK